MKLPLIILLMFILVLQTVASQDNQQDFNITVRDSGVKISPGLVDEPVIIAFATPLKQVSDYWRRSIDSFKGRMDEIGLPCKVYEYSTRVDENRKLRESLQSALAVEPDYIVVTLNDRGDENLISRLLLQDSPKVIVQNVTRPLEAWKENPPFLYVGFDHAVGTEMLADEYIRHFSGTEDVKYAMLYHLEGNLVSRFRGDHFNAIIRKTTGFRLVAEYYTQGDRESAKIAASDILDKHEDLDFIYACATDTAFGVLDALKESGRLGQVMVNGWGGGTAELEAIISGELDLTVMRMNDDNGAAMAEAIRFDLESRRTPQVYSGDMVIVNRETNEKYIESFVKRSFRYSGE